MSQTFKKTKKRMGRHINKYVFRKGRKKDKSTEDSQGSCEFKKVLSRTFFNDNDDYRYEYLYKIV